MSITLFELSWLRSIEPKIKFNSFNEDSWKILSDTCDIYKNLSLTSEKLNKKDTAFHKKQLIEALSKNNFKQFRLHLGEYRQDCEWAKQQKSYLKLQSILDNQYEIFPQDVKTFWKSNCTTSHLTSHALYIATQRVLPVFENFHELACYELELFKRKLCLEKYLQFAQYLANLARDIQEEKKKLCAAMVSRLMVASLEKNILFDDISCYMLSRAGLFEEFKNAIGNPRRGLTKSLFLYFHCYVMNQGNADQKKVLEKTSWLSHSPQYFSQLIDSKWVIIPRTMEPLNIPKSTKRSFLFINNWNNIKARFFKQHFYYLTQARFLEENPQTFNINFRTYLEIKQWAELDKLHNKALKQYQTSFNILQKWVIKYLFKDRYQFYQIWSEYNSKIYHKILDLKINYASHLLEIFPTFLTEFSTNLERIRQVEKNLVSILVIIEKNHTQLNIDPRENWCRVKKTLLEALNKISMLDNKKDRLESSDPCLKVVSTQGIISQLELEQASQELVNDEMGNEKIIYNFLHNFVDGNKLDLKKHNFIKQLSILGKALKHTKLSDINILSQFWFKFFIYYLNACLCYSEIYVTELSEVRDLISTLAPIHIVERMKSLQNSYVNHSSFVYKTRCQAMLFSFMQNKNLYDNSKIKAEVETEVIAMH